MKDMEKRGGERKTGTEREGENKRSKGRERVAVMVVTWCFTPCQSVRLYQGDDGKEKRQKRKD